MALLTMLVGSATKSVIAGSRPRATGYCASQPTRSSGNARQSWKRSTPPSPKPLRRRFAPAPPRPAGRRPDSPCLDYSGIGMLGAEARRLLLRQSHHVDAAPADHEDLLGQPAGDDRPRARAAGV